jgi:electron transfer flavoprotein alpha subunit
VNRWQVFAVNCRGPQPTALPELPRLLLLVFQANAEGEALAGAVAAANGATILGRITTLVRDSEGLLVSRSSHGGRLAIQLRVTEGLVVATANNMTDLDGEIELGGPTRLGMERVSLSDQSTSLESARIVIAGGRGLDAAGFAQLERIAATLGGAVAASLPAVDIGLAPVSRQVGQSGKFVTPEIYFAVGLSGTPQHLAGIGSATRIIAVNTDRDASIFRFAETGAEADAHILLPLLGSALESLVGKRSEKSV